LAGTCSYCGGSIETIGIDRINSTLGYVLDNVTACCSICNTMKFTLNVDDFLNHVYKIAEYQGNK